MRRRSWLFLLLLAVRPDANAASSVFDRPTLVQISIEIDAAGATSLRREPRKTVAARVLVEGMEFARVGLHLKGAQGSFRPFDDKPSLTLRFDKFEKGTRFHGLTKVHLNNSVQDPTYLCEDLAGELFRRAGVPAARTAWATVQLNGRRLGLCVLKEGFTGDFLRRHFADGAGNLYDGGLHHDVNEPLERDSGDGPGDHADLRTLAVAAALPNAAARWNRLQSVLDVDRFLSFMATEILAGHIDGYSLMQNNYRIYVEPPGHRAVFLPHGMDRMFGDPGAPLAPPMKGLVALAITTTPEGAERYRQRMAALAANIFDPDWMTNRINAAVQLLEPVEPLVAREAGPLRDRVVARARFARVAGREFSQPALPESPSE